LNVFLDAPEASDNEIQDIKEDLSRFGIGEQRSLCEGRPVQGKDWRRASNSGSATASSTGSFCGGRFSPEMSSEQSQRGAGFGCESERFRHIVGELDGLEDGHSESDDQPAELVPLRMRSLMTPGSKNRRHHQKPRHNFSEFYKLTDEHLGSGAYASVRTGVSYASGEEFAIKLVDKHEPGHTRSRILREVGTFNLCKGHPNIVQLQEWFEDEDYFYLVFEKMRGGPLLNHIQQKGFFTEQEASKVTRDIASALKYLHDQGIAHRDVKPENVLCSDFDRVSPVKLCDLDLASKAVPPSPPKLPCVNSEPDLASPVGSAEFMAPEVVDAFVGDSLKYDKRCDMWSLGVIVYIMICGYPPFYGQCWRENCGWDQGLPCNDCQEYLFKRIQRGEFDFPEPEWKNVSEECKDLICHLLVGYFLLVKNVRERLTADEVLKHPWVRDGAPDTKLQTPGNLFRNDSARDVHQIQEHFNVMNRMVAARLSARIENFELNISKSHENVVQDKEIANDEAEKEKENIAVKEDVGVIPEKNNNLDDAAPTILKAAPVLAPTNLASESYNKKNYSPDSLNSSAIPSQGRNLPSFVSSPVALPQVNFTQDVSVPVPQLAVGNQLTFCPNGYPQPQHGIQTTMSFPQNPLINLNGYYMYNHFVAQQVYLPQRIPPQQMYKFGIIPTQFMAPPPTSYGIAPSIGHRGVNGYQRSRKNVPNASTKYGGNQTGLQKGISLISVQSAAALAANSQPAETCQTAMARQDSKSELPPQARETRVNV
uniref:Protein kinase domain-containing protein n=1 Tax=Syphacia muris TaxID=451379 RepID=A0A0N5B129_9BILA